MYDFKKNICNIYSNIILILLFIISLKIKNSNSMQSNEKTSMKIQNKENMSDHVKNSQMFQKLLNIEEYFSSPPSRHDYEG